MFEKSLKIDNLSDISLLFGNYDQNIKIIEEECNVSIILRENELKISGEEENTNLALDVFSSLIKLIEVNEPITEQNIRYTLEILKKDHTADITTLNKDIICITSKGRALKTKTIGQKKYVEAINNNTITFAVGPAGTGKTYLAVALAVKSFKNHEINRIVLTRPAVEAGEKLGFLPGDLQNKVDPYLRPLYDALFDMLGPETYLKLLEKGNIEVAPLAYMRGRTLDDSFIILDEAQNTTPEQMKMLLTRLGQNSKAVITGDVTQIDLKDSKSGLIEAIKILKDIKNIETIRLTNSDVVRHHIIQEIIKAYEKYNERNNKK